MGQLFLNINEENIEREIVGPLKVIQMETDVLRPVRIQIVFIKKLLSLHRV